MDKTDPVFGAAVMKQSFIDKDMLHTPGFKFVYNGTLRELGVNAEQVDAFIETHKEDIRAHIRTHKK